MGSIYPVSIHGGHSGQFCSHAEGTLNEMVLAYIARGYPWVGITEHMPPVSDNFLYPEEKEAGLTSEDLKKRFSDYMAACRRLRAKYTRDIRIYVGFETEDYTGSREYAKALMQDFAPDYVVGSLHHVKDLPFDSGPEDYEKATCACGGIEGLYEIYFDQQYEMIQTLQPKVVGHMDIIRLFDPDYRTRLSKPNIWKRVERNLEQIKKIEPYPGFQPATAVKRRRRALPVRVYFATCRKTRHRYRARRRQPQRLRHSQTHGSCHYAVAVSRSADGLEASHGGQVLRSANRFCVMMIIQVY